jgi:hypothetical protein
LKIAHVLLHRFSVAQTDKPCPPLSKPPDLGFLPLPAVTEINIMKYSLQDRLLKREYGDTSRYSKIRGIYADRHFVRNLDIVNELNGHTGCVNALRYVKQRL